jgi:hypothetical protein
VRIFDGDSYRLLDTINYSEDADNVRYDQGANGFMLATAAALLGPWTWLPESASMT